MSRFYTQTTQYKKLQNDHLQSGNSDANPGVAHHGPIGNNINNNTSGKIASKQQFYQVVNSKSTGGSGSAGTTNTNQTPATGSAKLADRHSPIMHHTKLSTHLLDHGYGATPQPQQFLREATPSGKPGAGKDFRITNYYKVSTGFLYSIFSIFTTSLAGCETS